MSNAFKTPAKLLLGLFMLILPPLVGMQNQFVLPVNALSSMEVALLSIAGSALFYQVKMIRLNCAILTPFQSSGI